MFDPSKALYFCASLLFLLLRAPGLPGQDPGPGTGLSYDQAIRALEEGEYRMALESLRGLVQAQPGHVTLKYYTGRCLVELNEDLDEAIEMLYSASKGPAPDDVLFYLGEAYHRNYNFPEALKYYQRFELEASREEMKKLRVKQHISTCRSAREITSTYNQYEVMTVAFLDLHDSLQFSQVRMQGGQLTRKPAEYFQEGEDPGGLNSLMFLPANPARGDYIFYAGPGRSDKNGTQLFRVRKTAGRVWGESEEIRELNSDGDELLPYFDPIENDLYFASNGREGIGGFDLYLSHYDAQRDEWAEPINLGFPINSAMDEFLLLPGSDLGMLMFFSNREGTDSTLTVYRVHLIEPKKKTDTNDSEKLREIASLGGAAGELLAELELLSSPKPVPRKGPADATARSWPARDEKREITRVTILQEEGEAAPAQVATLSEGSSAYREILSEALLHQAASDSLKDLATSARARIRVSADPNDRWVWQKQIILWEKKSFDQEELADALFTRLGEGAEAGRPGPSVNAPERVEPPPVLEGEPGTQPPGESSTAADSPARVNRFEVLGSSPYDQAHPIPVDVALPDGVFYRIQMGAFAQQVDPGMFSGVSPITAESVPDHGIYKYYAGKFSQYEDASAALTRVRSKGYEDAFIVSWYNGLPISTQKAKQLEQASR